MLLHNLDRLLVHIRLERAFCHQFLFLPLSLLLDETMLTIDRFGGPTMDRHVLFLELVLVIDVWRESWKIVVRVFGKQFRLMRYS